jgi:hypothetical protein
LTRQSILPKDVDARDKPGHDGGGGLSVEVSTLASSHSLIMLDGLKYLLVTRMIANGVQIRIVLEP